MGCLEEDGEGRGGTRQNRTRGCWCDTKTGAATVPLCSCGAYVSIGRNALLVSPPLPRPIPPLSLCRSPPFPLLHSFAPSNRLLSAPLPASLLCASPFLNCSLIISVITPSLRSHVMCAKRRGRWTRAETGLCSASQTDIRAG